MKKNTLKNNKGFTIVELIVSIGIFAFMTALLLAKYGNFNQGVLLNNLAYDIALTIRNAQSYGLNVKSASRSSNEFLYPYGVYFDTSTGKDTSFIFFTDRNSDGLYTESSNPATKDLIISKTSITRGSKISTIYRDNNTNNSLTSLNITFKRPDPNAIIKANGATGTLYPNAQIRVMAIDGTYRDINVSSVGQISVLPNK